LHRQFFERARILLELGNDASGFGIAVGAANDAYLTGITSARDFLTTPDAPFKSLSGRSSDAFVTKITDPGP